MSLARPVACAAALLALVLARPAQLDGAWQACGALWAYLFFVVALPGLLLRRRLVEDDDALELAGFGLVAGLVLHLASAEICLRLGAPTMAWLPCVLVGALCWTRGRTMAPASWWWLALVALAALRAHHREPSLRLEDYDPDLLWHAGNAAEYLRGPAMQDPRVAGLAFDYHVHAYALPAVAARTLGLPIAATTMSLLAALVPVLAVLATALLARRMAGAKAGAAAGLALLLACDPALALDAFGLAGAGAWRSNAYFEAGLWNSPTTAFGLLLFLAALERVHAWTRACAAGAPRRLLALQLVACAWAMAGAKGSTAPVLVAGLAAGGAWCAWRTRRLRQPLFGAAVLALVGAAPAFVRLGGDADGYAQSMFRLEPFAAFTGAPSLAAAGWSWPAAWLLFPAWLLVFCGAPLVWLAGSRLWRAEGAASGQLAAALGGCALAGTVAALCVSAAGLSQLFFAYNSVACVAVLGGAAAATLSLPFVVGAAAPFFLCGAARLLVQVQQHVRPRAPLAPAAREWFEGASALRREAREDALVVARSETLLLSAYTERRTALETPRFTPSWHAARRDGRDPRAPFLGVAQETARAMEGDAQAASALLARSRAGEAWLVEEGARLVDGRPAFSGAWRARKVAP